MKEPLPLGKLAAFVGGLAVAMSMVVIVVGAIYAVAENSYTVAHYLEDVKTLVFGLAAVLIALELPRAVTSRIERRENRRNGE